MITIIDQENLVHLIPREKLVHIALHKTDHNDPPGTLVKLMILYDSTTANLGQMVFYFTDQTTIEQMKQALLTWAAMDAPNQLIVNASPPPASTPAEAAGIAI